MMRLSVSPVRVKNGRPVIDGLCASCEQSSDVDKASLESRMMSGASLSEIGDLQIRDEIWIETVD
jgi:hypothetical protein